MSTAAKTLWACLLPFLALGLVFAPPFSKAGIALCAVCFAFLGIWLLKTFIGAMLWRDWP